MNYYFAINLSYEEFLPYYQGQAQVIVVKATNGQRIQFPAMHMRQYLTPTGIHGKFCLKTHQGKFSSLEKLS